MVGNNGALASIHFIKRGAGNFVEHLFLRKINQADTKGDQASRWYTPAVPVRGP